MAMRAIDAFDPATAEFVRRFTLVANIIVDDTRLKFSSGSTGEYIGRSMFINAHVSVVDRGGSPIRWFTRLFTRCDMHEVCEAWVPHEEGLPSNAVVESPWTGATLLLRNFLQAFVWFGLTHFWTRAQHGSPFEHRRIEENLTRARRGFLKGPLVTRIAKSYATHVAPPLLTLIDTMQQDIVAGAPSTSVCR